MTDKARLLEKYFEKTLSPEEQDTLSFLVESDPSFAAELAFQKQLQASITLSERESLKRKLQAYENEQVVTKPFRRTRKSWLAVAAVAAIALVIFTLQLGKEADLAALYASNYTKYPNVVAPVVRGDNSTMSLKDSAFAAYESKLYQSSILMFERLYVADSAEQYPFYIAMSLMEVEDYNQALHILELHKWSASYKPLSDWYRALCYLKTGDKKQAKDVLNKIMEQKSFNFERAIILLDKL